MSSNVPKAFSAPRIRIGATWLSACAALAMPTASFAYITVGQNGTYPTIQQGVDAAIANAGDSVRVQAHGTGPYGDHLLQYHDVVNFTTHVGVSISGGWDPTFTTQDRAYTIISRTAATSPQKPLVQIISLDSAVVTVAKFKLQGDAANADYSDSGAVISTFNSSTVLFFDNIVSNNGTKNGAGGGGAGLYAVSSDSSFVSLSANRFESNLAFGADTGTTNGAGVFIRGFGGTVQLTGNYFGSNYASNTFGGTCRGAGVAVLVQGTTDVTLSGNRYEGNANFTCGGAEGDAAYLFANGSGQHGISFSEEIWDGNQLGSDPGVYQVFVRSLLGSRILARNSLIVHGTWGGIYAETDNTGQAYLSNLTLFDNPSVGATANGSGAIGWNILSYGATTDLSQLAGGWFFNSLEGVDPQFISAANGNFRLRTGSPAIDAGNSTVFGGLRAFDLDYHIRPYNGGTPDIGAYEYGDDLFRDAFDGKSY